MKWESHKKITGIAAKIAGLPKNVIKLVTEASILPDVSPDYDVQKVKKGKKVVEKKYRMNHHDNPRTKKLIKTYLEKARKKYKKNDLAWTEDFGRAAHYIQDYVVNVYKKEFFLFKKKDKSVHDRFEARLTKIDVPYDDMVRTYREEWYPSKFSDFMKKELKISQTPEEGMHRAAVVTSAAMKLVVDPTVPHEIRKKYEKWKIVYIISNTLFGAATLYSVFSSNVTLLAYSIVLFGISLVNPEFWKYYKDTHW